MVIDRYADSCLRGCRPLTFGTVYHLRAFFDMALYLPTSLVVRVGQSARRVCLCVYKQLLNEITFDLHI